MTFGLIVSTWRNRNGSHCATSSGSGLRFSGGRHLMTFAMYTSSRFSPIASMICVSFWPARPTNGMPWMSSSAAGRLADEHQVRVGIADTKDNLLPAELAELASRAVADVFANGSQSRDRIDNLRAAPRTGP